MMRRTPVKYQLKKLYKSFRVIFYPQVFFFLKKKWTDAPFVSKRLNPIHTGAGLNQPPPPPPPPSHFFLYNFWSIHSYTFKFCDFSKLLFESIMEKKFLGKYAAVLPWQPLFVSE